MIKNKSIGIIGGGFVGTAIARYYGAKAKDVKVYDKYKDSDSLQGVLKQDFIFVAVPTPFNQKIDLSFIDDAMANVASAEAGKVVIIKSTIVPGTTERYQKTYPHLKLIFNPEFLTESTADADFAFPDRQILGYTPQSYEIAGEVRQILPLAPFSRLLPATTAEMVKYFGNNWFSVKVVYANQMYEVCEKLGINYDDVMEAAAADKRIGTSHLEVWHKGYRGYGGKCLPKDIRAMIKFGEELGVDLTLLKAAEEVNNRLTGGIDR
ncbi:MAG: UDP-glucose/GDP-mannose dehydrogenase family protein [Candidatus Doudnabacteria bacterium]|nr:UDP-glucose/GDP-mannose dehydrogenase family protein [Candidatus Doudnabacteria bacterium]